MKVCAKKCVQLWFCIQNLKANAIEFYDLKLTMNQDSKIKLRLKKIYLQRSSNGT